MHTETIEIGRLEAHKLWQKYLTHRAYEKPIDEEIRRVYGAIAKGKVVIKALESIRSAGLGEDGFPRLAIARADATLCYCQMRSRGGARITTDRWTDGRTARSRYFDFPEGTFPVQQKKGEWQSGEAIVPHIPPDIRPARGIENYHVLFEAIWSKVPPYDPMLLRRIGKGDLWLVVAAWDLTEVERAALASRIQ